MPCAPPEKTERADSAAPRYNEARRVSEDGAKTSRHFHLHARLVRGGVRRPGAPDIYAGEQEQPHHVDEVPVPSGEFEAQVLFRGKLARQCPDQADDQEDRADDDMGAVEPRRHEECRPVDVLREVERRLGVFISLHAGETQTQRNGEDEPPFEALAVIMQQRMMRPGDRRAGGQEDQGIEERQMPRIKGLDPLRRPFVPEEIGAHHLMDVVRKQGGGEIGPEPCHEEHDFGRDEKDHAVAV